MCLWFSSTWSSARGGVNANMQDSICICALGRLKVKAAYIIDLFSWAHRSLLKSRPMMHTKNN